MGPRGRRAVLSLLLLVIGTSAVLGSAVACFFSYAAFFQIPDDKPVGGTWHVLGLVASLGAGSFAGFAAGFAAWLLAARYLLGYARADVEPMISGRERPPLFGPLFEELLDAVYPPTTAGRERGE